MRHAPLFIPVSPAGLAATVALAVITSAGGAAFAGPTTTATTSISGYVMHCGPGPRSVTLTDVVQVDDGRRTYAGQLNTDGSFSLVVDQNSSYILSVYVSRRAAPVWRQRIAAGPQPPICLSTDKSS